MSKTTYRAGAIGLGVGLLLALVLWLTGVFETGAPPDPPQTAQRIVVFGPNIVDTIGALGGADRIAGVDTFSLSLGYAPEGTPTVGDTFAPNTERLATLQPDVVLTQGQLPAITEFCTQAGVPQENLAMNDLAAIRAGIFRLGMLLEAPGEADALIARIDTELLAVREAVADRPAVKVLLVTSRLPGSFERMGSTGPGTFLDEALRLAGGENVLHDAPTDYPEVTLESVMVRGPEVIIELRAGERLTGPDILALLSEWAQHDAIPAAREGNVAVLTEPWVLSPGPRFHWLVRRLAEILHPEAFTDAPE